MSPIQHPQLAKSRLGSTVLLSEGFRYTKRKQRLDGSTNWRCEMRSCPGSVITDLSYLDGVPSTTPIIIQHKQHSHQPVMSRMSIKTITKPSTSRKCSEWLQCNTHDAGGVVMQVEGSTEYTEDELTSLRELLFTIRSIPMTMQSFTRLKNYKHEIADFLDNNIMSDPLFRYLNKTLPKKGRIK